MKNRFAFLGVLLLVSTMMLGSIPIEAEARTEYDTILRIASQAHEEIKIQLDRADSVPDDIQRLFQDGTDELNSLKEAIRNEEAIALSAVGKVQWLIGLQLDPISKVL